MTEYEIKSLLIENNSLLIDYLMFWVTVSTSLVLIGHFINQDIHRFARISVSVLYLFMSVSTILGYFIALSQSFEYGYQLEEVGETTESNALMGKMSGYLGAFIYLAGTVSAVVYFLAKTKPE